MKGLAAQCQRRPIAIPFLPHDAVLSITVKAQDTDSAASDNLRVAQNAILGLVEAPDTSQIKESPYAPLQDVVASLATFMDIADALAQVRNPSSPRSLPNQSELRYIHTSKLRGVLFHRYIMLVLFFISD